MKHVKMNLIDDDTLLKMAEAEILGEAKRAAIRHSVVGVSGWQPCPKPNKVFLANTLLQTVSSNRHLTRKKEQERKGVKKKSKRSERKLLQKNIKNERINFIYKKPDKKEKTVSESVISSKIDKSKFSAKKRRHSDEKSESISKFKSKKK